MRLCREELDDLTHLWEVSRRVFDEFEQVAIPARQNRQDQRVLAQSIAQYLDKNGYAIQIQYETISKVAPLNDPGFERLWSSSSDNLSWLFLHEAFSRYFFNFMRCALGRELFLLHETPKTASSSVHEALETQGKLAVFYHTSFDKMVELYGLLGFGNQQRQVNDHLQRQDPLLYAGHYNLPDLVSQSRLERDVRGLTTFRNPVILVSSALRYVWGLLARHDEGKLQVYPDVDIDFVIAAYEDMLSQEYRLSQSDYTRMVRDLTNAAQFRSEYGDILTRYYTNNDVVSANDVGDFFKEFSRIQLAPTISRQAELLSSELSISCPIPKANTSVLTISHLNVALGGEDKVEHLLKPLCSRSLEIYAVLHRVADSQSSRLHQIPIYSQSETSTGQVRTYLDKEPKLKHNTTLFQVIRSRLEKTSNTSALIFDAGSQSSLAEILPRKGFPDALVLCEIGNVPKLLKSGIGSTVFEWFTFSILDEARIRGRLMSELAVAGLQPEIISCLNDVFSAYLGRDLPLAEKVPQDARIPDLPSYAIVCAPRCGSTFLTEMLASVGLGRPEEHLREREIAALSDLRIGDNDAASLFTDLLWKHQRNFIFGTKVVSHFLFDLKSKITVPETVSALIRSNLRIIYLVRKDKVRQAISDFLANRVKIWHVRDEKSHIDLRNKHAKIEYSFDEILSRYKFMLNEDERLTKGIQGFEHIVMFYEDLVAQPIISVTTAAEFLGFKNIGEPKAIVVKSDSPAADNFCSRFMVDYESKFGRPPADYIPTQPVSGEQIAPARFELQSLAELKNLSFGQYQKRSWQIADYKCRWCSDIGEFIRADHREPGPGERFIMAFGSAHTFAPYVLQGYTNLLASDLGLPLLNFGIGGAGPDFFARPGVREKFIKQCNQAAVVIFQVMSCRTMGSSVLPKGKDPKNSLIMDVGGKLVQFDSERAMTELRRAGRDRDLATHLKLIRESWCDLMKTLAAEITAPKVLFWFSNREPKYEEKWPQSPGTDTIFGNFPQLINEKMIGDIQPHFDSYVEVVYPDLPEPLINRFSGKQTKAVFGGSLLEDQSWLSINDYYPSTAMHRTAADALRTSIAPLLS
jgi:LPS sulfotransferase NodH